MSRFELWDLVSANCMGTYPTLNDLVHAAYGWGQANPKLPAEDIAAVDVVGANLRDLVDEYLAGIERGFEHWENDHPVTGEHLSGDPKVVILSREQWLEPTKRLRAALEALR